MTCKYCAKDLEYRLCSLCGDIFPKELFYVTGKKEHTCDDGTKKIIEYRRSQCSECYLADQKELYLKDRYVHNKQYEDIKKKAREEELRKHKINTEKLKKNLEKYGKLLITFD